MDNLPTLNRKVDDKKKLNWILKLMRKAFVFLDIMNISIRQWDNESNTRYRVVVNFKISNKLKEIMIDLCLDEMINQGKNE